MRPALARQGVEYRGADLHRWAFAADRGAREQGAEGQQYLAEKRFSPTAALRAR